MYTCRCLIQLFPVYKDLPSFVDPSGRKSDQMKSRCSCYSNTSNTDVRKSIIFFFEKKCQYNFSSRYTRIITPVTDSELMYTSPSLLFCLLQQDYDEGTGEDKFLVPLWFTDPLVFKIRTMVVELYK